METILLLSRMDRGQMESQRLPLDIVSLTRRIVDEMISSTGASHPIELTIENQAALPLAQIDETLLRHALCNLISNACKYSVASSLVSVRLKRDADSLIISVRDRGIGIPEEDREFLFEGFHRGANVGERPGTGLGLVIAQRCIQLHSGRITLEASDGPGTLFTLCFPAFV
jgi:signal transduction histidine kinase